MSSGETRKGIRIGPSDLHIGSGACPSARAAKIRPHLRRPKSTDFVGPTFTDFTLGPLMAALDRAEFQRREDGEVLAELTGTHGRFGGNNPPAHPGSLTGRPRHSGYSRRRVFGINDSTVRPRRSRVDRRGWSGTPIVSDPTPAAA